MNPSTKIFFAIVLAALIIGLSIYFASFNKAPALNQTCETTTTIPTTTTLVNASTTPTTVVSSLNDTSNWKTFQNSQFGFQLKYPLNFLNATPKITAFDCNYKTFLQQCTSLETDTSPQQVTINGIQFCLYEKSVSANNNVYTDHYYATVTDTGCLGIDLVTVAANCDGLVGTSDYDGCNTKNTITTPQILKQIESTFQFSK
jgi:hypothetical protein